MNDEGGRYELGFPYRAWPRSAIKELWEAKKISDEDKLRLENLIHDFEPHINIRFATDADTAHIMAAFNGTFPVYRSIYRFRECDEEGKPVRNSAVVDKLFFEFEHQACGELCEHVTGEVSRFIHWLRRQGFEPWILYSGGKSLHVYLMFDEVKLVASHESVKRALKIFSQRARLVFVDHKAMLGTAQMARVMNARNPKTGMYAVPIRCDEVLENGPKWVHRVAQKPRLPTWKPLRNNKLRELLVELDKKIAAEELMRDLFPPVSMVNVAEGEMCGNVTSVLNAPPDHRVRGHVGLRTLIIYCYKAGKTLGETLEFVLAWNDKSEVPMGRGYIRYQTEYAFRDSATTNYSPCLVASSQVGGCPKCMV